MCETDSSDSHSWQNHPSINPHHNKSDKFLPIMGSSIDPYQGRTDRFPLMANPSSHTIVGPQQIPLNMGLLH